MGLPITFRRVALSFFCLWNKEKQILERLPESYSDKESYSSQKALRTMDEVKALWVKINLPHLKPILNGCCYWSPIENMTYQEDTCEILDNAFKCGFKVNIAHLFIVMIPSLLVKYIYIHLTRI